MERESYSGVSSPKLQIYLLGVETHIISKIEQWPLRIRSWAQTQEAIHNIHSTLNISKTEFLWLTSEVRAREIIDVQEKEINNNRLLNHKSVAHFIDKDNFRALSVLAWGYPIYRRNKMSIDDWGKFVEGVRISMGTNRLVHLINDPTVIIEKSQTAEEPEERDSKPRREKPQDPSRMYFRRFDYENPEFEPEEKAQLDLIDPPKLMDFRKECIDDRLERLNFMKDFDEPLDIGDPKIRAIHFINEVRKLMLSNRMKIQNQKAVAGNKKEEFTAAQIGSLQTNFDVNMATLDGIIDGLTFSIQLMNKVKGKSLWDIFEFARRYKKASC